jgi:hypothetical protein
MFCPHSRGQDVGRIDLKEFYMAKRNCSDCGIDHKETLFGTSRELKTPSGQRIFFCSTGCRKNYLDRNKLNVYDRHP